MRSAGEVEEVTVAPSRKPAAGWPKGVPRKLRTVTVRRVYVSLCQGEIDALKAILDAHPELTSEGDAVRYALRLAAGVP